MTKLISNNNNISISNLMKPIPRPVITFIDTSNGMAVADLEAIYEDLSIEADSKLRSLRLKQATHLLTIERAWRTSVTSLDDQIRQLSLNDFITLYDGDTDLALRAIVSKGLKVAPMGQEEQSIRTRKRAAPASPIQPGRRAGESAEPTEDDVFATGSKRPRAGTSAGVPSSSKTGAGRNSRTAKDTAATATRSTRARPRGAVASTSASATASTSNFVYRSRSSILVNANSRLPPTPLIGSRTNPRGTMNGTTAARKPRRGESIVMLSVNDSPLGVGVAGEEGDEEEDEDDGAFEVHPLEYAEDEQDERELAQGSEASRVEDQPPQDLKGKGKGRLAKPPPPPPLPKTSTRQSSRVGAASPSKQHCSNVKSSKFIPESTEFTFNPPDYKSMLNQLSTQLTSHSMGMSDQDKAVAKQDLLKLLANL